MYYADCHDDVVRIHLRYSIFVALKPPTPEEQRRVLQRLAPPDSGLAPKDSAAPASTESTGLHRVA